MSDNEIDTRARALVAVCAATIESVGQTAGMTVFVRGGKDLALVLTHFPAENTQYVKSRTWDLLGQLYAAYRAEALISVKDAYVVTLPPEELEAALDIRPSKHPERRDALYATVVEQATSDGMMVSQTVYPYAVQDGKVCFDEDRSIHPVEPASISGSELHGYSKGIVYYSSLDASVRPTPQSLHRRLMSLGHAVQIPTGRG